MTNEYAPLSALKRARKIPLSDTADDQALMSALEQASRAIDDRTGRWFWLDATPAARIIRSRGRVVRDGDGDTLLTPDMGAEPTLVEVSDDRSTWSTVAASGYFMETALDADGWAYTGITRINSSWDARFIRVTAQWGWPSIPKPIENATLLLANRRFVRLDSPEGVAGFGAEGQIRISRFDPDIEDLVSPYVLPGFA